MKKAQKLKNKTSQVSTLGIKGRIIIIGICGAGKSTFAKKLSKVLDKLFFKPNWEMRNKENFKNDLKEILNKKTWIIDGNYNGTMPMRIEKADTIIYLDFSTSIAMFRVFKRRFQSIFKQREDVAEGCKENINYDFLKYVYNFNKTQKPETIKYLENIDKSKQLIVFKNDKEVDLFLEELTELKVES